MITKEIALTLKHGDILYHVLDKNVDGTPRRCRVSGKVKTWKKSPDDFDFPIKIGLYGSARIDNNFYRNYNEWMTLNQLEENMP